ncbi:MAG: hypothetical protein OEQ53_15380, partial [Saprospiraceae bacterium]|nr:hypothetical protein [Saprospiraceae bacterium]
MIPLLPILLQVIVILIGGLSHLKSDEDPLKASIACDHPDYTALMSLYNHTNGPSWTNNSNWGDTCDVCLWFGVDCNTDNRVTKIFLGSNNLSGVLPPELSQLSQLTDLRLPSNDISGSLPGALGQLSNLVVLDLNTNQISGTIPTELGDMSNLERLILFSNSIGGLIPNSLQGLSNLEYLRIHENQLAGPLPLFWGSLPQLFWLEAQENNFVGNLPSELGSLQNLTFLHLGANQFTGDIPPEFGNISNLSYLALYDNQLVGSIPPSLSNLMAMTILNLSGNQLTGHLPPELGSLFPTGTGNWLIVQDNNLTGCIPTTYLDFCDNAIFLYDGNPCLWQGSYLSFCSGDVCSFDDYTLTPVQSTICERNSISLQAGGGGSYTWSTGETTPEITVTPSQTSWYHVTITTPASCVRIDSVMVTVTDNDLNLTVISSDESAPGAKDGTASVTVDDGIPGYTYIWSTDQIGDSIIGLSPGTFYVTVTDAVGCEAIDSTIISTSCPPPGTSCDDGNPETFGDVEDGNCNCLGVPCPSILLNMAAAHVSCSMAASGSAFSNPSGGAAPYSFLWSTGAITDSITHLMAGSYQLTVTDVNGCHAFESITLTEPSQLFSSINGTDESAPGANDGSADLIISGGTSPYLFAWSNGEITED